MIKVLSGFSSLVLATSLLCILGGAGCAATELKNINRRLKEANDHLVAENNRLQQELAASEKEVADKSKQIDSAQDKEAPAGLGDAPAGRPPAAADLASFDPEPGDGMQVVSTPRGILLRLEHQVFFAPGQATLTPRGQAILKNVARTLNTRYRTNLIRVEGHTDDVPVNKVKSRYPSNWELSTARACAVVRFMVSSCNLGPTRIYPAGFANFKPIASARTTKAREKNRRVEILILNERA